MAEFTPQFEADDDHEGGSSKKKGRRANEAPGGYAPLPKHERAFLRPLRESAELGGLQAHDKHEASDHGEVKPRKHERHEAEDRAHEIARSPAIERELELTYNTPEQLAALAANQAQDVLELQQLNAEKSEKSDDDEDEGESDEKPKTAKLRPHEELVEEPKPAEFPVFATEQSRAQELAEQPEPAGEAENMPAESASSANDAVENLDESTAPAAAQPEVAVQSDTPEQPAESAESIMRRNMPAEFTVAASGPQLGTEQQPDSIAERLADADADFAKLSNEQPGSADAMPEASPAARTMPTTSAERPSDDDIFRDIARNETGEDPGQATLHDFDPGGPPIYTGESGGANGPPRPPTGEGASYGDEDPYSRGYNPFAPAGDMLNPAAMAGISAVEARRELDSLKHSSREAGLAGAVGLLGLGLVLEHIFRKREARRLRRDIKKQGKELQETGKTLQQEQFAHHETRSRLNRLAAEHAAGREQLRRLQTHEEKLPAAAEATAGVGLISAAAAAELAARTGQKVETSTAQTNDWQELARQPQSEINPNLDRAIKRNPELQDAAGVAATAAVEPGTPKAHELRDLVGASAYAEAFQRERSHESLQIESPDKANQTQRGDAGATAGALFSANDSASSHSYDSVPNQAAAFTATQQDEVSSSRSSAVTSVAIVVVVVAIVGILLLAFLR